MKCPKCNGLITTETIIAENQWIEETYCVNCGKRIHSDVLTTRRSVIKTPKKWEHQRWRQVGTR